MNELKKKFLKKNPEKLPTASIGVKFGGCGIALENDKTKIKQIGKM